METKARTRHATTGGAHWHQLASTIARRQERGRPWRQRHGVDDRRRQLGEVEPLQRTARRSRRLSNDYHLIYGIASVPSNHRTHHLSPIHSVILGLKRSFSADLSHRSLSFLLRDWLHGLPGLFIDTFEHICFFTFSLFRFLVSGSVLQIKLTWVGFWAHVKIASRIVSYRMIIGFAPSPTPLCRFRRGIIIRSAVTAIISHTE